MTMLYNAIKVQVHMIKYQGASECANDYYMVYMNTGYTKLTSFFLSNRFMDSVTVLTIQKERTVSVVRQVIMTDHGDLQLLKTPMNVEVWFFFLIKWLRWITLSTGKITIQ